MDCLYTGKVTARAMDRITSWWSVIVAEAVTVAVNLVQLARLRFLALGVSFPVGSPRY